MTKCKKVNVGKLIFILAFTILPIINFAVFYLYANFSSFLMGFQKTIGGKMIWTFSNFTRFFEEISQGGSVLRESFRNTFITFGVGLVLFALGVMVSYFLYKKIWLHKVFRILFFIPSVVSVVVLCNIYTELVSSEFVSKLVQKMFNLSHIPSLLSENEYVNFFILLNFAWLSFPGSMIIWGGTFSRVPNEVLEAAKLDGVNWFQELIRIIIPIVWPTFALMFTLSIAGVFGATGQVFLLTGGDWGTQTFSNWMYMQVYSVQDPRSNVLNYLSAVGLCISIVACSLAIGLRFFTNRFFREVEI